MKRYGAIFAYVVLNVSQAAFAQDGLIAYAADHSASEFNNVISSARWPSQSDRIGFKDFYIGMPFEISGNSMVRSFPYKKNNGIVSDTDSPTEKLEPFMCDADMFLPIFSCKMILWNDPSRYPPALQAMQTAFGNKVKLSFDVLLSHALTSSAIANQQYGSGQIQEIEIQAENPNAEFTKDAIEYFNNKMGTSPKNLIKYDNPQRVYSPQCQQIVSRLYDKPKSSWSQNDEDGAAKCNQEVLGAVLSGRMTASRINTYTWSSPAKGVNVTVSASESTTNIGGQIHVEDSNAVILIETSGLDVGRMKAAMLSAISSYKATRIQDQKKDF